MFLIAREGGREVLWLSAGENLCATSSTFAGRRHMIGKVFTGCVAILPYHTATQDRGSECRDFGFISRIVTALMGNELIHFSFVILIFKVPFLSIPEIWGGHCNSLLNLCTIKKCTSGATLRALYLWK